VPCTDIKERCELTLGPDDRVVGFSLHKDTCGAPVGTGSILPLIAHLRVDEVLDLDLQTLMGDQRVTFIEEFMLHKELVALRRAAAVYLGQSSGDPTAPFVLESIHCDGEHIVVKGLSQVAFEASEVTPCGGCASC